MLRVALVGVILSVVLCAQVASGATVKPIKGSTSLNNGSGYIIIKRTSPATSGDKVIVGPGGLALIKYNDTCVVRVESGRIYTVTEPPPCGGALVEGADAGSFDVGVAVVAGATLAIKLANSGKPASP